MVVDKGREMAHALCMSIEQDHMTKRKIRPIKSNQYLFLHLDTLNH